MTKPPPAWLPPMISVEGDWRDIVIRLYQAFERDFKKGQPSFEGRPVWWNRRILSGETYEEGFWHLITRDDRTTGERLPDFRRAERLPWCTPTIRNDQDPGVKVWDYEEGSGKIRTYLWLESLDYVVILEKQRKGKKREAAFLVTAFHLDGESTRRSMRRKYERRYR